MADAAKAPAKKAERGDVPIVLPVGEDWPYICKSKGRGVIDVYSDWCGPCSSMMGHLRRIKLELGDEYLTLAIAKSDTIEVLEKFRGKAEPTWLLLGSGKPVGVVHGANGPLLLTTIRDLVKKEQLISKGKAERDVVLLESLVKPEEVLEPDEDLDDIEGEMANTDSDAEGEDEEEKELTKGILFIHPHIISTDRAEIFLSAVVGAGFEIIGHVQEEELNSEQLTELFDTTPKEEEGEEESGGGEAAVEGDQEGEKAEGDMEDNEDGQGEENGEEGEEEAANVDVEEDLEYWTEALSHGPLYLLLLKVEEGDLIEIWYNTLGPTDLETAREKEPESLVAQFGEEEQVLPAWMPKTRLLQEKLSKKFFPPPPGPDEPRLLILKDQDHVQVIEKMGSRGVKVMGHTQVTFTEEHLEVIKTPNNLEALTSVTGNARVVLLIPGKWIVETIEALISLLVIHYDLASPQHVQLLFLNKLQDQPFEPKATLKHSLEQARQ
ncbi:unnamed protein product, partial [Meganyctiphanes norvegica]